MPFVSARCFVGTYSLVLIVLFILFVYLLATFDPIPAGYVIDKNASTVQVQTKYGVLEPTRNFTARKNLDDDEDEMLFAIESPNKASDGIVYGPFPIVFDDLFKNETFRTSEESDYDNPRRVYPPVVPLVEIKGNKTNVKTMILSKLKKQKLEPKSFYRRSVENEEVGKDRNKTLEVKILDDLGISRFEIKVPMDPNAGNDNITVLNNLKKAGYNVIVNVKEYKEIVHSDNGPITYSKNVVESENVTSVDMAADFTNFTEAVNENDMIETIPRIDKTASHGLLTENNTALLPLEEHATQYKDDKFYNEPVNLTTESSLLLKTPIHIIDTISPALDSVEIIDENNNNNVSSETIANATESENVRNSSNFT